MIQKKGSYFIRVPDSYLSCVMLKSDNDVTVSFNSISSDCSFYTLKQKAKLHFIMYLLFLENKSPNTLIVYMCL